MDVGGWALPVQPGQKRDVLLAPHLIRMFNCGKMPPQLNLILEDRICQVLAMRAVDSSLSYQIENVHLEGATEEVYPKPSNQEIYGDTVH